MILVRSTDDQAPHTAVFSNLSLLLIAWVQISSSAHNSRTPSTFCP